MINQIEQSGLILRVILLKNEILNIALNEGDKVILEQCKNHFTWHSFESNSTIWWNDINTKYFKCKQLIEIMSIWLDNKPYIDIGGDSASVDDGEIDSHSVAPSIGSTAQLL